MRCGMGALTAMAAAEEEEEGRACGGVYWGLGGVGCERAERERDASERDERCESEPSECE